MALVAGLYLAGLLIVTLDLSRYGLSALGFDQAAYVLSGTVWAAPVAACFGLLDHALRLAARQHLSAASRLVARLWLLGGLGIAPLVAVAALTGFPRADAGAQDIALGWVAVIAGSSALALTFRRARGGDGASLRRDSLGAWLGAGLLMLASIALWAIAVFPNVSPVLGGGKRPLVDLILTPAGAAAAPELPLPVSPDGQRVGPVVLLSDRARTVFVGRPMARPSSLASSVKRERAVGVERRNIEAIVFLTRGEARPE